MADETVEEVKLDLAGFLSSVRLETEVSDPTPMLQDKLTTVKEDVSEEERFLSSLASVVFNMEDGGRFDKSSIQNLVGKMWSTSLKLTRFCTTKIPRN